MTVTEYPRRLVRAPVPERGACYATGLATVVVAMGRCNKVDLPAVFTLAVEPFSREETQPSRGSKDRRQR